MQPYPPFSLISGFCSYARKNRYTTSSILNITVNDLWFATLGGNYLWLAYLQLNSCHARHTYKNRAAHDQHGFFSLDDCQQHKVQDKQQCDRCNDRMNFFCFFLKDLDDAVEDKSTSDTIRNAVAQSHEQSSKESRNCFL